MAHTMLAVAFTGITFMSSVLANVNSMLANVDSSCTAFATNGNHPSVFSYYRLYDFRNINVNTTTLLQTDGECPSPSQERIVSDSTWTEDWHLRDTPRKSSGPPVIPVYFTPERVKIVNASKDAVGFRTYLSLTTARISTDYQEGGEIVFTEHNISSASIRIRARLHGASGAVFGFFTYYNDENESDIEIRTQDPTNMVHYSNQPAFTGDPDWLPIPGATVNKSLPDSGKWTDWHVHRLDWLPDISVFYVDDKQMNETKTNVPRPFPGTRVYVDIFSQNSSWSGPMEVGKSAEVQIQWIKLLFNSTSLPTAGSGAGKTCKTGPSDPLKRSTASLSASYRPWAVYMAVTGLFLGFLYLNTV